MGRQSLQIQPQPEPRFITEYKKKKELHRKTQGNIFLYDFSEETTNGSDNGSFNMCATPDILKEVKEVISILTVHFVLHDRPVWLGTVHFHPPVAHCG